MWKRITGCFAIVLLVIYLFFMYDETVLSGILVLVILYPVCACGFLLLCRKKITASLDRVPPMGRRYGADTADLSRPGGKRRFGVSLKRHSAETWKLSLSRSGSATCLGSSI